MSPYSSDLQSQKEVVDLEEVAEEDFTEFSLFAGMNFKNVEKPRFSV